jgi:hypothetical protein
VNDRLLDAADAFHRVLGVREVRSLSTSQAAPNPPNPPNPQDASRSLPGDELYPLFIAEAGNRAHITEQEFSELYEHHKLVERARERLEAVAA